MNSVSVVKEMMMGMKEHGKLTERQFAGIIANTMLGAGTLVMPRTLTSSAGTGSWIAILIGGGLSLFVLMIIIKLGLRFPEETIIEYGVRLTNKWIGGIISFLLCTYWLMISALVIRIFASMLNSTILLNTPIEVIIIAMLLTITYFVRGDVEIIGRINELYFIFVIFPIIYAIFLGVKEIHPIRLLPVTGGQGITPILFATISSFFSFLGYEIVFLLIPSITTKKLAYNYGIKGITSPLFAYICLTFISVGIFGIEELQTLTWPTLELVKVTPFPGLLFERLESFFISFWVIAIFTTSGNLYYSSILGFTQLFKIKEHKTLIFPLLPVIYLLAVYPENIYKVFKYMNLLSVFAAILIVTVTFFYYIIAIIREKKGDEDS